MIPPSGGSPSRVHNYWCNYIPLGAEGFFMVLKIYTKTGDKGETSLFGGKRVPKYSLRVEAYGTVDELNSFVGLAEAHITSKKLKKELILIKNDLLEIGSHLASPSSRPPKILEQRIRDVEKLIDSLTISLPELKNFILTGEGKAGAFLHVARTVCRRVERRVVELFHKEKIDPVVLRYFNRLSDLLFTMARFVNHKEKKKERIWIKNKNLT